MDIGKKAMWIRRIQGKFATWYIFRDNICKCGVFDLAWKLDLYSASAFIDLYCVDFHVLMLKSHPIRLFKSFKLFVFKGFSIHYTTIPYHFLYLMSSKSGVHILNWPCEQTVLGITEHSSNTMSQIKTENMAMKLKFLSRELCWWSTLIFQWEVLICALSTRSRCWGNI